MSVAPHVSDGPKRAIVLCGGGARGAYEAGVLAYIFEELPAELIAPGRLHIVCGTSVGAIHAGYLAATAHTPRHDIGRMIDLWRTLRIENMLRLSPRDLLSLPRELQALFEPNERAKGVLINSGLLRDVVKRNAPWGNIRRNLEGGYLEALTVSCTHIMSGKTTVFVDRAAPDLPPWTRDPRVEARRAHITAEHALASAAIPLLFPPVKIDGSYYSDGGLRQNTPLSPALRLGADRVLVVALRHEDHHPRMGLEPTLEADEKYPGAFFLLGKVVDALMLDRLEYDVMRLQGFNLILEEGTAAFGPDFVDKMRQTAERMRGQRYRSIDATVIRPSRDIGEMAAEFVDVLRAQLGRLSGYFLKKLAAEDVLGNSDLLSYLLFDGRLGAALIELGRADADGARDRLIEFFRD